MMDGRKGKMKQAKIKRQKQCPLTGLPIARRYAVHSSVLEAAKKKGQVVPNKQQGTLRRLVFTRYPEPIRVAAVQVAENKVKAQGPKDKVEALLAITEVFLSAGAYREGAEAVLSQASGNDPFFNALTGTFDIKGKLKTNNAPTETQHFIPGKPEGAE